MTSAVCTCEDLGEYTDSLAPSGVHTVTVFNSSDNWTNDVIQCNKIHNSMPTTEIQVFHLKPFSDIGEFIALNLQHTDFV